MVEGSARAITKENCTYLLFYFFVPPSIADACAAPSVLPCFHSLRLSLLLLLLSSSSSFVVVVVATALVRRGRLGTARP